MATRRKRTTRRRTTAKRTTPTRRRRRSKVGFIKGVDFKQLAGLGTGAVTGKTLDMLVNRFFPTLDDNVKAGVKVAIGLALPKLVKLRGWDNFIKGVGDGWVVNGFGDFAESAGLPSILNGLAGVPSIAFPLSQSRGIPVVNGNTSNKIPIVAGSKDRIPVINGCQIEELENNY